MPLKSGHSRATISKNIHEMVAAGHPAKQAVAASLHNADKYAMGGEIGGEGGNGMNEDMDDDKALLEHVALECMHAIEMKDKSMFLEAFEVLISHIVEEMQESPEDEMKEGEG